MSAGGVAFAYFENFWLLLLASVVAVINPRYVIPFCESERGD